MSIRISATFIGLVPEKNSSYVILNYDLQSCIDNLKILLIHPLKILCFIYLTRDVTVPVLMFS
ncbi:hypothetical protein HZS_6732 [Henneguya salminicola]|nr:hypothetical protein HZS_6732 [Henneguya salminicola]